MPHVNPGVLAREEIALLRRVSASQGLMLESTAERLCERGGPHFGSPDKRPAVRLETLRLAGEAGVPFTTGILIGIGETRRERIEALLAIRRLHEQHGHIQEVIVQNFRAKPGTRMARAPDAAHGELLWSVAVARLILGAAMNIQAPPNLSGASCGTLIDAGINDWGGVSPVTPDHVNPEAPWPAIAELEPDYRSRAARYSSSVSRAIRDTVSTRRVGTIPPSPSISCAPPMRRATRGPTNGRRAFQRPRKYHAADVIPAKAGTQ